ncbi:retinoschisin-like, partial, partial [Paramuricea clavata]
GYGFMRPQLEDKRRFPDSSFGASASLKGHGASDARISSGNSWCAPVLEDKHYLQVNLRRLYSLYYVITYGDSISPAWVATYNLNYTIDLVNWKTLMLQGNKNAYHYAAWRNLRVLARALRFIPLTYVGQPCMRVDTWGLSPSGPSVNIRTTSRSASSLFFAWDVDHSQTTKQHGVIISYTACVSRSENGPCFQKFITSERKWLVRNLNASTKYYVRVFASTKVGHGNSDSRGVFTDE